MQLIIHHIYLDQKYQIWTEENINVVALTTLRCLLTLSDLRHTVMAD